MSSHILIVEDNKDDARVTQLLLEAFGHTSAVAWGGEHAVEAALRERPDLVLMDLLMARVDGYESLRRIRSEPKLAGLRVIALTIVSDYGTRDAVLQAGFDGYIAKPVVPTGFARRIDGYLRGEAAHDEDAAKPDAVMGSEEG